MRHQIRTVCVRLYSMSLFECSPNKKYPYILLFRLLSIHHPSRPIRISNIHDLPFNSILAMAISFPKSIRKHYGTKYVYFHQWLLLDPVDFQEGWNRLAALNLPSSVLYVTQWLDVGYLWFLFSRTFFSFWFCASPILCLCVHADEKYNASQTKYIDIYIN